MKSFRQKSNMIIFMFDDHFSCFRRLNCRGAWEVVGTSLSGNWANLVRGDGCWLRGVAMGMAKRTELRHVEVYLAGLADGSDEKVEGKREKRVMVCNWKGGGRFPELKDMGRSMWNTQEKSVVLLHLSCLWGFQVEMSSKWLAMWAWNSG